MSSLGTTSQYFSLKTVKGPRVTRTRLKACDRVVGTVHPGLLAGSSLHFSLHRPGQSRASGPEAQMWLFVSGPRQPAPPPLEVCPETGLFGLKCLVTDKETLCRDPGEAQLSTKAFTILPQLLVACTQGRYSLGCVGVCFVQVSGKETGGSRQSSTLMNLIAVLPTCLLS